MKNVIKFSTILLICALVLVGCKDSSLPIEMEAAIDRGKGIITKEKIPENSYESAILNHGFANLENYALQGNVKAQHFLSLAYLSGEVVPKNFELAEKWARRAANQGSKSSQYLLGMIKKSAMQTDGIYHIHKNAMLAYMWFSLAAAQGHEEAIKMRDQISTIMSGPENYEVIKMAQEQATAWRPCNDLKCMDYEPDFDPFLRNVWQ